MTQVNLHSVHMHGGLLALECKDCRHRIVLEENKWRDSNGDRFIHKGNMKSLDSIRFVCSECKSKNIRWVVPKNWDEADLFLAGSEIRSAVTNF
jgi:ribosomal protein L33